MEIDSSGQRFYFDHREIGEAAFKAYLRSVGALEEPPGVEEQRRIDIATEHHEWDRLLADLDRVAEFAVTRRMERYGDDRAGLLLLEWRNALERHLGWSIDPIAGLSVVKRLAVFDRDGYECQHCGARRLLTVDHVTPRARGGTNAIENLQTLCQPCNSRKGTR